MDKMFENGKRGSKINPESEEDEKKNNAKILVVDDENTMRNMLSDVLLEEGHEVFEAPNGEEAVKKLREEYFELVITDIMMPGLNGIGVLKAAKEIEPGTDVIVMTGYASVETAVESMRLGASDYITKPFNIDQIKIVVSRTLKKRVLERKAEEGEFYKELSKIDTITQLFNHKTFHQLLEAETGRAKRHTQNLSLILADIDNFKIYNEINGYPKGDFILKQVALMFTNCCRNCDLIARYGGDEFAVIIPGCNKEQASLVARRIKKSIDEGNFDNEEVLPSKSLTISIGLASFPEDAGSKKELIEKVEEALREAKLRGVSQLVIYGKN